MGQQATCRVEWNGQSAEGEAHLETDVLLFRSPELRLTIPLGEVRKSVAMRGTQAIEVNWSEGSAVLYLGKAAPGWYTKIRYPKTVIDKLGVKTGMRVAVLGIDDAAFLDPLAERTEDVARTKPKKDSDLIFCLFETPSSLSRLSTLRSAIKPNGAIWTVYPKGRKDITQAAVMAAGKAAGLVDVKVVGFSETHSSLKWVIPVAERG